MITIRWIGRLFTLLLLAPSAACELAEVATAPSEEMLVVEAVLRAGAPRQFVLLHRTLEGSVVRGEPDALVTVRMEGEADVVFLEGGLELCADGLRSQRPDTLHLDATCYFASSSDLRILTGRTYELRVTTADGRTLRGRTTVPGNFRFRVPPLRNETLCNLPAGTNLPLAWSPSAGAWSYIASIQISNLRRALRPYGLELGDRVELTGVSVSETDTTMLLPAHFGLFERADTDQQFLRLLQGGFPDDVHVELAIAAADRNFVNAVRGGSFNPSGPVRISSVVGDGVGVFGSVVVRRLGIYVGEAPSLPGCLPSR